MTAPERRTDTTTAPPSGDHAPDQAPTPIPTPQATDRPTRERRRLLSGHGPKWQQIADDLRAQITSGDLAPGDDIPTEITLQERYGVARATVRQAIQALRVAGLIIVEQGRGSKVRAQNGDSTSSRMRLDLTIRYDGQRFRTWDTDGWMDLETPSVFQSQAGPHATVLTIDSTAAIFVRERQLGHDSGAEIMYRLYLPFTTAATIGDDAPFLAPADLYQALTDTGHDLHWDDTTTAAMPTPDEAATLDIPDGVPVLVHTRLTLDNTDRPLALEEAHLPAHRVTITAHAVGSR